MRKIIQITEGPRKDRLYGLDDYGALWSWDGSWQLETLSLPMLPDPVDDPIPGETPLEQCEDKVALNIAFK